MSQTLATVTDNVRYLLNDRDKENYAVSSSRLSRIVVNNLFDIASKVGLGQDWDTAVVTLTAGSTADYSLSGTSAYSNVAIMRIADTGDTLQRVSLDEINGLREGIITGSASQGDPAYFALWEDSTQALKMRIDCVPVSSRTIDALVSAFPAVAYTDATYVYFSDPLIVVLQKQSALEVAAGLTSAERERLGLNPDVFSLWARSVTEGIHAEQQRLSRLKRGPYGIGAVVG